MNFVKTNKKPRKWSNDWHVTPNGMLSKRAKSKRINHNQFEMTKQWHRSQHQRSAEKEKKRKKNIRKNHFGLFIKPSNAIDAKNAHPYAFRHSAHRTYEFNNIFNNEIYSIDSSDTTWSTIVVGRLVGILIIINNVLRFVRPAKKTAMTLAPAKTVPAPIEVAFNSEWRNKFLENKL